MPELFNGFRVGQKRKRVEVLSKVSNSKVQISRRSSRDKSNIEAEIQLLEQSIGQSQKPDDQINTLLEYARDTSFERQEDIFAVVALCRVFCRLLAVGSLNKSGASSESEVKAVQELKRKYQNFKGELLMFLRDGDIVKQSTALALSMKLVKEDKGHVKLSDETFGRTGFFSDIVRTLVEEPVAEDTRKEFVKEYVENFVDVRYYTFVRLAQIAHTTESALQNKLSILTAIHTTPDSQESLDGFFVGRPEKAKHDLHSLTAHKKQAQRAWMTVISSSLGKAQRKTVLELMSRHIAPWFLKVELLMDFLTDSFDIGGSTSLLALSGLFYLVQHKNLDYPQFYEKLYSMVDHNVLHSKHRSRFFRLLDTFLSSTHLPAALVASFIKRLSRLTLHAPPSGIVVVPWIYNLLKTHPSCTFMVQRSGDNLKKEGEWGDPFRMDEPDPMESYALESSLWEVHMLQNHYHPNVATVAKIISEQFTKQNYNLEDFFDHSYGTVCVRNCFSYFRLG